MGVLNLRVQATALLRQVLADAGMDVDDLLEEFCAWKVKGEFSNYYFGKDGAYSEPRRNGRSVLWHVHVPPESDPVALAKWDRAWRFGSRMSSDAALIYTYDPAHGFLLLFYAIEPTAHSLAEMNDFDSRELMTLLADVAEQFIFRGTIAV
jgi:hypothetical protein